MRVLGKVFHVIDVISEWSGKLVSFLILPLIIFIVYDVVMRYVFNAPTDWAHEVSYFMFGALWVIGGAFALRFGAHVKMEVIYERLPLKVRAILDLITAPLFFAFLGVLLWTGWELAWSSVLRLEHSNSFWSPPVYPVKLIIPLGAFLFLLQGIVKFIRDLITATTGRESA